MGKLKRFRESLSMPQQYYQVIDEKSVPSHIQESLNKYHSINQHLTEANGTRALIKIAENLKMNFKEGSSERNLFDKIINKLKETGATDSRKLWKFPVSRFGNLNGNGRIYPRELWENVINNQKDTWLGCCGLADHPLSDDDPGEFKNSGIVWLDMMIDDANKLIWAIGTFVGTYGRLAQEIIEAGGRVGFSSSGFGELLPDNKTIDPDSYIIERVADIVTNPSQSVFGDASNENAKTPGMSNGQTIEYSGIKKPTSVIEENIENKPKSKILEEKNRMAEKVDAVKNIENRLRENCEIKDCIDKYWSKAVEMENISKDNSTSIAEAIVNLMAEDKIDVDKINKDELLSAVNDKVEAEKKSKPNKEDPKVSSADEKLKESSKLSTLTKLEQKAIERFVEQYQMEAENITDPVKKLKEVKEILNMLEDCDNEDLKSKVQEQLIKARKELEQLSEGISVLRDTYKTDNLAELSENVKNIAIQGKLLNEQVGDYKLLCEGLQMRNRELHKENSVLKSKLALKEAAIKNKDLRSNKKLLTSNLEVDKLTENLSKYKNAYSRIKERNSELLRKTRLNEDTNRLLKEKVPELNELRSLNEKLSKSNKDFENKIETLQKKLSEAVSVINHYKESSQDYKQAFKDSEDLKTAINYYEGQIARLQDKNKKLAETIKEKDQMILSYKSPMAFEKSLSPKRESYVDGYLNFRENKGLEVENYWNDLVQRYGESVKPFENQIRGSKTYREAVNQFLKNRQSIDSSFALAEAANISPNVVNKRDRKRYLENAGMKFQEDRETTFEEMQEVEAENIRKLGFR